MRVIGFSQERSWPFLRTVVTFGFSDHAGHTEHVRLHLPDFPCFLSNGHLFARLKHPNIHVDLSVAPSCPLQAIKYPYPRISHRLGRSLVLEIVLS